jgi:hypothetical protein
LLSTCSLLVLNKKLLADTLLTSTLLISSWKVKKPVFDKRDFGQTNEQQPHFNEEPISELHAEVDSIQTILKLLFSLQQ